VGKGGKDKKKKLRTNTNQNSVDGKVRGGLVATKFDSGKERQGGKGRRRGLVQSMKGQEQIKSGPTPGEKNLKK